MDDKRSNYYKVYEPAVSRLLSEIQRSLCACSIGNEPQNTLVFSFSNFKHCVPGQHVGKITLCHHLFLCIF